MLARLLRLTYLVQLVVGGLIGSWAAVELAPRWGWSALTLVPLLALAWVIFWQALIIGSSMLLSRRAGPLLPWLRAAWGELMAALLIFGLRQPWAHLNPGVLHATHATKPGDTPVPVLLVHGFVCNHRVWDGVAQALRQRGHSVLALDLEPLFTSIDDYAPLIEQAVTRLCQATHTDQVALVGHSMGGLVIRAWLRAHGNARAAQVITLGTPHHGTQAPQWVSTPNGRQMAWHSAWLTDLARSETAASRPRMSLAITSHDNVVFPQREQTLEGARVTEFSGIGHLQMCLDSEVLRWLLQELEPGRDAHTVAVAD